MIKELIIVTVTEGIAFRDRGIFSRVFLTVLPFPSSFAQTLAFDRHPRNACSLNYRVEGRDASSSGGKRGKLSAQRNSFHKSRIASYRLLVEQSLSMKQQSALNDDRGATEASNRVYRREIIIRFASLAITALP